jgi:hypothetical protein
MRSNLLPFLLVLSWGLVSCDKTKDPFPSKENSSGAKAGQGIVPQSSRHQSKEVLPKSREVFERNVRPGQMRRTLVHDTPSMDKDSLGNYSYLGAAREFKAICGFDLPDWVEPREGNFTVSVKRSGPVRHSWLEYQIDPARRAELEKLITEANAREFLQRHPVKFYSGSDPAVSSGAYIDFKPDGKVKESMAMAVSIDDKGTVTLRASRGPVGWDD